MTPKDPFDGKEIIRFEDGRYVGEVQGDIRHGWGKYNVLRLLHYYPPARLWGHQAEVLNVMAEGSWI